jgi:hypothetical protein
MSEEAIFEEDKQGEENATEEREERSTEEGSTEEGSEEGSESGESESSEEEADPAAEDAGAEETEEREAESEGEQPLQIELPKDSLLDESHVKELTEVATELGLNKEQAQAWMDDRSELVSEMIENAQSIVEENAKETLKKASAEWKEELKNDSEVGGERLQETAELAKRFAEAYLPKELIDWLDETGYGNQPGLVKAFRQAAIDIGIAGDGIEKGGNYNPKPKSDSELFYGNS